MNEIVNKVLLTVDKFMPQIHLKQPGITYSACGPFTKKQREEFKKLKKQEIQALFTKMNLAFFQHDMAYGDFKDLTRRAASDKVLRNKAFNVAKILNIMDIKEDLLLWFTNVLIKSRREWC